MSLERRAVGEPSGWRKEGKPGSRELTDEGEACQGTVSISMELHYVMCECVNVCVSECTCV